MIFQHNLNSEQISIYVHWPFCLSKCPYCDFNSHIVEQINIAQWIKAYKNEIDLFKDIFSHKYIKTIYFGGGTPSLMPIKVLDAILNQLSKIAIINDKTEITLEANPTSSEQRKFEAIQNAGINRISIGVQSFNEQNLQFLGRNHNGKESIQVIEMAKKIFPRISFDLIYALPQQKISQWQSELEQAMKYAAKHISLYQLTIEKGTKFYSSFKNKEFAMPKDNLASEMYDITNQYLAKHDLYQYEISNYASPGEESQHNLAYWKYNNYIGIGAGAHSRFTLDNNDTYALMMKHKPSHWLDSLLNNDSALQTQAILSKKDIVTEILMMGLRLTEGIRDAKLQQICAVSFKDILNHAKLEEYISLGYCNYNEGKFQLTGSGLKLHSYIVPRLLNI